MQSATSSSAVLSRWRQALATRLLVMQLLFGMPLIVWAVPKMVASRAWVLLANLVVQVGVQAAMTAWRTGPLVLRGGVAAFAFIATGAGVFLGGGDSAVAVLFLMTALVLGVVVLGLRGAAVVLVLDVAVLATHVWAPPATGPRFAASLIHLTVQEQLVGLMAVYATLGSLVLASVGFLVSRLRQSIDDVVRVNEELTRESREKARALETLNLTQDRLIEAGKMELLGQLAGGIAHDMNNALTVVLSEAHLLRETDPEASTNIAEAVEHATKLTQQLLVMGRRDAAQPRTCELGVLVEKGVRLARRTLPGDIDIVTSLAPRVFVRADPSQIQQVVLNLATNARDAMPSGGRLGIKLTATDSTALLEVSDTGEGMADSTRRRIFEPFFTTKALGKGTGLGLSSVSDVVVSRLGGAISCESVPGAGTTFTVSLPRLPAAEVPVEEVLQPAGSNGLEGRRIMVAEDDIRVRALVVAALEAAGAVVIDVATASHAIALLQSDSGRLDLVWTDVVMPDGGASRLLSWITQNRPTRIIICSGYADDELIRRDVALGRYRLLSKPFTAAQAVAACLAELRAGG